MMCVYIYILIVCLYVCVFLYYISVVEKCYYQITENKACGSIHTKLMLLLLANVNSRVIPPIEIG